jgi:uncharacterized repeat protein (TIGR01451 family)
VPPVDVEHHHAPLFQNSSFETGTLANWTLTTALAAARPGIQAFPVLTESQLGLRTGGVLRTNVRTGAPYTLIPPGLAAGDTARYPRFGSFATVLNELGSSNNVNRITQSAVVTTDDIDPADGLVHVRFVVLPVLQNPGHVIREQPYYYVTINNVTKGTVLASRFNFSNEAGVPWQSNANASVVYTDWLLFDLPMARDAVSIGDTLSATVIAAGCALGGHWGEAIIDSFGSNIPGLVVYGSGPDSASAGSDFQYAYRVINGGTATATGTRVTAFLPAGTTFRSIDTPGISCSTPEVGTRGTLICQLGLIPAGASFTFRATVRADSTVTEPIRHGWYFSESNQERPLIGPLITTAITPANSTQYVDLVTTVDDGKPGLSWGQSNAWAITVRNTGPTTATNAPIASNTPAQLSGLTWTCTGSGGGVCGASSGTGALATTATLPPGASVTYVLDGTVVSGTGTGMLSVTARAQAPAGTIERFALDNGAGDDNALSPATVVVTVVKAGTGEGAIIATPAGLSCDRFCGGQAAGFSEGTEVTLQAVAAPGSVFVDWQGPCSGAGPCIFNAAAGNTVTATFMPNPVLVTSPNAARAAVGRPFTYRTTAVGTAPFTFGATGLPAWLTLDPVTGVLSGTPPAAGSTTVALSATDVSGTDTMNLVITAGVAPTITSAMTFSLAGATTAWTSVSVTATGTGPIQYNASGLPGLVYFNSTTGAFLGNAGAVGVFNVPVVATNAFGSDYRVIAVSIGGAPIITSPLTASATVGTPFSYTLTATGTNPLTLNVSSLPAWATFDAGTRTISGTPTSAGRLSIGLSAANTAGSSSQTLVLTVDGPAVITSALSASGTAREAFTYALTAEGTTPIARAVTGLPGWLTFDAASGLLTGTPPAGGTFTVTLSASNALGSDSRPLAITIASAPPAPTPPSITSATSASGLVGQPFSYTLTASGQVPMTLSASSLPAWASFDAGTGVLSGTPPASGTFSVGLSATNTLGTDARTLVITISQPPVITSELSASAVVGQPFTTTVTALGTAPLTFSATPLPAWATLDASTGVLSGTPDAEAVLALTVSATNAVGSDAETLVIIVRALPTITSPLTAEAVVGVPFSYTLVASGTAPVTLGVSGLPGWASFDASSGVVSGTPDAAATVGIGLSASNGAGADTKTLTLVVRERPAFTSSESAFAVVGLPFSFTVTTSGTAPVSLSASGLPGWATFEPASGLITGTPDSETSWTIALAAQNAAGQATQSLTVVARTRPRLTGESTREAVVGTPFTHQLTAVGTPPLTFEVDGLPGWLSFDASGTLSGTPVRDEVVSFTTRVRSAAGVNERSFTITTRTRPIITSASLARAAVGQPFTFELTATGTAPVSFSVSGLPPGLTASGSRVSGTPQQAGSFTAQVTALNAAGTDAEPLVLEVRSAVPTPVISAPLANDVLGTRAVVISGTAPAAEAGGVVTIRRDGVAVCDATIQPGGAWSCTGTFVEGAHSITATLVDPNGFGGAPTLARPFSVDTTVPAEPTWSAPAAGAVLASNQPALEGRGEPGAVVDVRLGTTLVCSTRVGADGTWRCQPTSALPDGVALLSATQTDAAGNVSPAATRSLTIDTRSPAAPVIDRPQAEFVTRDPRPLVSGTAEADSAITVFIDGQVVCRTRADAAGRWTCQAPTLADGRRAVEVEARDEAGNISSRGASAFVVDTTRPEAPRFLSPAGRIVERTPRIQGTAEPLAAVAVSLDGQPLCQVRTTSTGDFGCDVTTPLALGPHRLSATATDEAGNRSDEGLGGFDVQVARGDVSAPAATSSNENAALGGQATPGSTVTVYVDGQPIGSTIAGDDGTWRFDLPRLPPGERVVSIGVSGSDGSEVFRSSGTTLTITQPVVDLGGGLGCSSTAGAPWWAALAALVVLLRRRRARQVAGAVVAAGLLVGTSARAQAVAGVELEQQQLNPAGRGGLVVGGADVLLPGDWRAQLALGYQHAPLQYFEDGVRTARLVDHRLTAWLSGAFAITRWLELGASVPVVLTQSGTPVTTRLGETVVPAVPVGATLGTPWLQARVGLLSERAGQPLDLGITTLLGLPLGSAEHLTSDRSVSAQVLVGLGRTVGPVRLAGELGAHLRASRPLLSGGDEVVGSRALLGLGVSTVRGPLRGELSVRAFAPLTAQPVSAEVLAGGRYAVGEAEVFVVAGPGFGNVPGTPAFRAVVGIAYGGQRSARCAGRSHHPAECPDLDFDGDGVENGADRCPEVAVEGAADGCPLPKVVVLPPPPPPAPVDSDGDGLADTADACPDVASTEPSGCQPEPAPAPAAAPAEDEAPAPTPSARVNLGQGRIDLKGTVFFETSSAVLQARSFPLLSEVAEVLKAHPELRRVRIEGHTDGRGPAAFNLELSKARARAVRTWLEANGVEPGRLESEGYGLTRPIDSNDTAEGRERNRRVDFVIVDEGAATP